MANDSEIRIENIYYLLAYAWDQFRPGEEIKIDAIKCPDILNLLAWVLGDGVRRLLVWWHGQSLS